MDMGSAADDALDGGAGEQEGRGQEAEEMSTEASVVGGGGRGAVQRMCKRMIGLKHWHWALW